jgi:hypothetical protein
VARCPASTQIPSLSPASQGQSGALLLALPAQGVPPPALTYPSDMVPAPHTALLSWSWNTQLCGSPPKPGAEQPGFKSSDPLYLCSKAKGGAGRVQDGGHLSRTLPEGAWAMAAVGLGQSMGPLWLLCLRSSNKWKPLFEVTCKQ